jgi:hypothetical protein
MTPTRPCDVPILGCCAGGSRRQAAIALPCPARRSGPGRGGPERRRRPRPEPAARRGPGPSWVRAASVMAGFRWAPAVTTGPRNRRSPGLHAHDLDRRSGEGASSRLAARQCPVGGPTDAGRSHAAASGGTSLGHGAPDNGGHERIPAVRTIPPVELGKRSGPAASDEVGVPSHGRGHRFETCHAHCLGRSKVISARMLRPLLLRCCPNAGRLLGVRPRSHPGRPQEDSRASSIGWRPLGPVSDGAPAAPLIPLARRWSMACSRW